MTTALSKSLRRPEISSFLIIEDNKADSAILLAHIGKAFANCDITLAETLESACKHLQQQPYDFIILDLNLPDSKGLKTLEKITDVTNNAPILVYSGVEDSQMALDAVKMGAQDYLVKGKGNSDTLKRIVVHSAERKRIEKQLYMNEQMLRTFIRHSPAGIAVFDTGFCIVMASDRWLEDHGASDGGVEGKCYDDVCRNAGRKWRELYQQCLQGEHISCLEDSFVTNSGKTEYVKWEMMPWFDADGNVGGAIEFTEFITKQREMRLALEDAKNNLENKVSERTRELVSAMITAEGAQASKDEFFTNMTHELRTPLHAIINFSQFGTKKTGTIGDDKIREYFSDINSSGERLLGLVNDLLDLTKHKVGKSGMEMCNHSLSDLFIEVQRELAAIIETNNMQVICKVEGSCDSAEFDKRRVYQVLINLMSNAIKFSPKGSVVTFSIASSEQFDNLQDIPDSVVVSIADQGSGIPEDELDTVFDEFAQSSKVQSGSFIAGTGLGLAICRQIIQAHDGIIWAENNDDGGVTIRFVLPLAAETKD